MACCYCSGGLLWATGDAYPKGAAQDSAGLHENILRLNIAGTVPADNPLPGSYVCAWRFPNLEGPTVAKNGVVYPSGHGEAREDEINLIRPLQNYGRPSVFYPTRTWQIS